MGILENFKKIGEIASNRIDMVLAKSENAKKEIAGKEDVKKFFYPKKSIVVDLDNTTSFSGIFRERYSLVSNDFLRQLADKDMIVTAILNKMCNRVASFAQPQKNKYSLGFIWEKKLDEEGQGKEENPETDLAEYTNSSVINSNDREEMRKLNDFIMNTGEKSPYRPMEDRMSFETFLRIIVRDRLIYNQIGIECVPTKDKKSISYFSPVSGGSIRLALPDLEGKVKDIDSVIFTAGFFQNQEDDKERMKRNSDTDLSKIKYVQVYRGNVYAVFSDSDFIYRQGIPSVELAYNGYAPGELETLVNSVANHRIAESHNESFFRFGYANNGILNIKSDLTEEDLQGVKTTFQRQYQGVRNAFKLPILSSKEGIEFVQMGPSNKDMQFEEWLNYLIKVICAVYGLNPSEINFDISRSTSTSLGDGGSRNEIQLRDTRNSMLRPLLRWIESIINDDLMPRYNSALADKYMFKFVGLEHEDKDAELNRIVKQVTNYRPLNEVRQEEGLKPIKHGEVILNATFLQYIALKEQGIVSDHSEESSNQENQAEHEAAMESDGEMTEDDEMKRSLKISDKINELIKINDPITGENMLKSLKKEMKKPSPKLLRVEYYSK